MGAGLEVLPTRTRGRPTLYNSAYCDRALELAAEGCGKAEIAAALQVSVKTLNAWMKIHGEFRDAMSRAKELEYAWWLAAGRKGQFMRNWNASGWALQMRNRFRKRFRDRFPAHEEPAEEILDAGRLREEMERKLSRIADSGAEGIVSLGPDAAGAGKSQV